MENVRIRTTQNVEIEYQLASLGDRVLATLLDYLFFFAYLIIIGIITSIAGIGNNWGPGLSMAVFLPILLYSLVCETFFQGRSFGKMVLKIQVVKLDGTPPHFSNYLLRWALTLIDSVVSFGIVAILSIIINGKGQRLGDMAAGTTVIRLKQKNTIHDTILKTIDPGYIPVFKEATYLTDHDVSIIKEVLEFSKKSNNQSAFLKLAQKIKQTLGVNTDLTDIQFLETIIADYNHLYSEK